MDNKHVSRRKFISQTGIYAAGIAGLAPLFEKQFHVQGKSKPPMAPISLDISKAEYSMLSNVGGAVKIPNPLDKKKPIIVIRTTEATVSAFSSKCPHEGCEVDLPKNNILLCPCHDATFDVYGKVTKGPAKKDLNQLSATLEANTILIKEVV